MKLVKVRLISEHDNRSITKCFQRIIDEMLLKINQFSKASRNYNFQVDKIKLCGVTTIFLLYSGKQFQGGWGGGGGTSIMEHH